MANIVKRVQKIVGEQLSIDPEKVHPQANFIKELGADSLDVIELVMIMEYEFDIDIDDQYASQIRSVQDFLDYLENTSNFSK